MAGGCEVGSLLSRLAVLWRLVVTPASVRDVVDRSAEGVVDQLLPTPPAPRAPVGEAHRRLREMEERIERIERRNRELARLYARHRGGTEGEAHGREGEREG